MISTGREWLHWVESRLRRCPGQRQGIAADSSRSRNGIDAVGSTLNDPECNRDETGRTLEHKNFGAGRPMVRVVRLRGGASRRSQRAGAREVSSHAAASPLERHKREEAEQRGEDE